jgi:hypothetical protein
MVKLRFPSRARFVALIVAALPWILYSLRDYIMGKLLDWGGTLMGHFLLQAATWKYLPDVGIAISILAVVFIFLDFPRRVGDQKGYAVGVVYPPPTNRAGQSRFRMPWDRADFTVEITRFETLDPADPQYARVSDSDLGRLVERWMANGKTHVALLELEAKHASNRAKNWIFKARTRDGKPVDAKIVDYGWNAPENWGNGLEAFGSVDGARLESGAVHRVFVYLGIQSNDDVDMSWLSAFFDDDQGPRAIALGKRLGS